MEEDIFAIQKTRIVITSWVYYILYPHLKDSISEKTPCYQLSSHLKMFTGHSWQDNMDGSTYILSCVENNPNI